MGLFYVLIQLELEQLKFGIIYPSYTMILVRNYSKIAANRHFLRIQHFGQAFGQAGGRFVGVQVNKIVSFTGQMFKNKRK